MSLFSNAHHSLQHLPNGQRAQPGFALWYQENKGQVHPGENKIRSFPPPTNSAFLHGDLFPYLGVLQLVFHVHQVMYVSDLKQFSKFLRQVKFIQKTTLAFPHSFPYLFLKSVIVAGTGEWFMKLNMY